MNRFAASATVMTAFVGALFLAAPAAHAERTIQVTNGTNDAFWVMPYSRDDVSRSVTYGSRSFHVLPGQTSEVACSTDSCDLLLDRAAGASAPAFRDVRSDCINVTTYSSSRGIAAYSACSN